MQQKNQQINFFIISFPATFASNEVYGPTSRALIDFHWIFLLSAWMQLSYFFIKIGFCDFSVSLI